MNKKLAILIGIAVLLFGSVILLKTGNIGTTALWNLSDGGKWLLPLVGIAALIDSINPCAFGILLLTIAFLLSLQKTRSSILKIGGVYILGLLTVYILIGLGILQALHLFNTPHFMAKIGAVLLIALGGINLINEFFPLQSDLHPAACGHPAYRKRQHAYRESEDVEKVGNQTHEAMGRHRHGYSRSPYILSLTNNHHDYQTTIRDLASQGRKNKTVR